MVVPVDEPLLYSEGPVHLADEVRGGPEVAGSRKIDDALMLEDRSRLPLFQEPGLAGPKTRMAVLRTFAYLGVRPDAWRVTVRSVLPCGKGMASSSADISSACQAAAIYAGRPPLTAHEIADIALSIEPSDGIFYSGIMMFDHLRGRVRRPLGDPPPMTLAVFDAGGEVDTVAFNSREDLAGLNAAKETAVREALSLVEEGLRRRDPVLVGRGATVSALANQSILFKPWLQDILDTVRGFGAVGINTAHSGTVTGALFPPGGDGRVLAAAAAVCEGFPGVSFLGAARLIPGGLTLIDRGGKGEGGHERPV